ncbi:MAG: TonB C-terminal domain-containing protein [Sandaracinaceae bacterium]
MIRALHYEPRDGAPDTIIGGTRAINAPIVIGGFLVAIGFNLAIPSLVYYVGVVLDEVSASIQDADEERLLEEEDVIEARFVTLGRDFLEELPNRDVPLLDTAPPRPAEVPTDQTPVQQREPDETEERPPNAVDDPILRDVLNRSQVFAEIAEEREREGSPDGIEEGTEREGTEGDIYRGRLYSFFRNGWSLPTTMAREEASELQASATVQIGANLEIVSFEIRGNGSGDGLFDQSILEQLTRLQATGQHIPPPPEDVASQYIGQSIVVRFSGRQAH